MNVKMDRGLPILETYKACDIKTREEVSVLSGHKIRCLRSGNILLVSEEMWNNIRERHT